MVLCPAVSLLFPLGMAIRHRASSPLLPSYSHLFASLLFFSLLALRLLCFSWYWAISCMAVLSLSGMYCRGYVVRRGFHIDVMLATQLFSNTTIFPSFGTLEPRDIGTPSQSTGTLEPRDIGTPSAQGGERALTREPGKGTDPRNGFLLFRYTLGSHRRSLRCVVRGRVAHRGYDVLGRCTLVAGGLLFPRL